MAVTTGLGLRTLRGRGISGYFSLCLQSLYYSSTRHVLKTKVRR